MKASYKLRVAAGLGLCCTIVIYSLPSLMHKDTSATASIQPQQLDTHLLQAIEKERGVLQAIEKEFRNKTAVHSVLNKKEGNIEFHSVLNKEEGIRYQQCIQDGLRDRDKNMGKFWGNPQIRHTHHKYLKEDSLVLEVGGNKGEDTTEFVRLYNLRIITLEPVEEYANNLKDHFKNNPKVSVVNLGLSDKTEVIYAQLSGKGGEGTSKFSEAHGGTPLVLADTNEFFLKLGTITRFQVDLMSVNCEGCEYDLLEAILSSSLVTQFKNIQFAMHSTLLGLSNPIARYCQIQELLKRTHTPTYQYRFIWESWKRKDIDQV